MTRKIEIVTVQIIVIAILALVLCSIPRQEIEACQPEYFDNQTIMENTVYYETTEPCGMSAEELQCNLKDGLKPYAECFLKAEQEYNVNACFLASIAALESGWGTSRLAKDQNNFYGLTYRGKFMSFESPEKCIKYTADLLSREYLHPEGKYFNGYGIKDVNIYYCELNDWSSKVSQIKKQLEV